LKTLPVRFPKCGTLMSKLQPINYFSPPFGVAKSKPSAKRSAPLPDAGLDGLIKWEESYYINIHSSIHTSIQFPLKVCFNFVYIYVVGRMWRKLIYYDVHPSNIDAPPRCVFPFGGGGLDGQTDGLIWSDVKKVYLLWQVIGFLRLSVRPFPWNLQIIFFSGT
jgi:hypothetical protein